MRDRDIEVLEAIQKADPFKASDDMSRDVACRC